MTPASARNAMAILLAGTALLAGQELPADQILRKVDDVIYAPKDKDMRLRFVLIDKDGKESIRELTGMEKGADRRMMKFSAPADQKGIAFLSLPGDVMYVYLPAFGKTRRIASHVKNSSFAGTDLTYENLEAKRYSDRWSPQLTATEETFYHLLLSPKPGIETEYSKIAVTVRRDNLYPVRIEYFDKSGAACKIMTRDKIEQIKGYWEARETVMEDLKKRHKTKLILLEIRHDSNIPDDNFSERYLMR